MQRQAADDYCEFLKLKQKQVQVQNPNSTTNKLLNLDLQILILGMGITEAEHASCLREYCRVNGIDSSEDVSKVRQADVYKSHEVTVSIPKELMGVMREKGLLEPLMSIVIPSLS